MNIYSDGRIPYFYVIEHKETKIKYGGAKWGIDANPDTFMQDTHEGYTTSSALINDILKERSGVLYCILDIVLEEEIQVPFGCLKVQDYEEWYLEDNNCCKSMSWANKVRGASFGTDEFYVNMLGVYGAKHSMQIESCKEKSKHTCELNYGYAYVLQVPEIRQKSMDTKEKLYGDPFYINDEKKKETYNKNYGSDHYMSSAIGYDEYKSHIQNIFGDEYTNPFQVLEIKERIASTNIEKYGVNNPNKVKYLCKTCNQLSTGISSLNRMHSGHDTYLLIAGGEIKYITEYKPSKQSNLTKPMPGINIVNTTEGGYYVAYKNIDGKIHKKNFSCKKLGAETARLMAIEYKTNRVGV